MTTEKMTELFNILSQRKKGLTEEEELAFCHKKIGKAERFIKQEINKATHEWSQK